MTVKELIEKLAEYDPDATVVVDGYEDGYDDPRVGTVDVVLDSNWDGERKRTGWSGRHEYADHLASTRAVLIGR